MTAKDVGYEGPRPTVSKPLFKSDCPRPGRPVTETLDPPRET